MSHSRSVTTNCDRDCSLGIVMQKRIGLDTAKFFCVGDFRKCSGNFQRLATSER